MIRSKFSIPKASFDILKGNLENSRSVLVTNDISHQFIREEFVFSRTPSGYLLKTTMGPFRSGMINFLMNEHKDSFEVRPKVNNLLFVLLIVIFSLATGIVYILESNDLIPNALNYLFIYFVFIILVITFKLWREYLSLKRFIHTQLEKY